MAKHTYRISGEEVIVLIDRKKRRRGSLTLELILMTIGSLLTAMLVWSMVENLATEWFLNKLEEEGYYEERIDKCLQDLQAFIQDNQVTEDNIERLLVWVQQEKDAYIILYRDVDALFDPYMAAGSDDMDYYELTLADGTPIKAEICCYIDTHYFDLIEILAYTVAGGVFILLLILMIHQKIRYINRLEQELKILGSGNLEYPVTVKGNDEVTGLAEGIENLKNGILEQQLMKAEAEKANMELVTAMSHDLRTPLTSLIGYLELLNMHRYESEEQLHNYLVHCRDKAFQMKRMSDRLFEYFLVYGRREQHYQFRTVPDEELLEELCNGQFLDWQDQGGRLDCSIDELKGRVQIDSEYFQRVMDNLMSNLRKYGDKSRPLEIRAYECQDMLHILLTNYVREQKDRVESTQIGLKTCRKIIEEHGGRFEWRQEEDRFIVTICLRLIE